MTTRKAPAKSSAKAKDETATEDTPPTPAHPAKADTAPGFADQANTIATDARAFSEDTRAALDELVGRCTGLNDTDPGDDTAAADALRRLPMACSDIAAALQGLAQAAAELASKTLR